MLESGLHFNLLHLGCEYRYYSSVDIKITKIFGHSVGKDYKYHVIGVGFIKDTKSLVTVF